MPKVICTLENATNKISGVQFTAIPEGGMISEEVTQEVAEMFASIPGYEIQAASKPSKTEPLRKDAGKKDPQKDDPPKDDPKKDDEPGSDETTF
jgi:hypothetical protein